MQGNTEKINNKKSTKISAQTHIVEEVGPNGTIQYNCTACRKTFRSRSQKYYHINCNELQNLIYKCEYCDKCFARQTQWKYHTESHLSPVNECHKCQKTFSNPLALKKHLALHEIEPKSCPHCDKSFKKKTSLDQHIAAQHLNQLQYGCAYCNKKYASKSSLQLHLQTHEKKRFECNFCGKLFQRNSILNLHRKRHNKTESYICSVCQKGFSESGALARHRKIHEETVLQYYCKLCEKSILRKDNMTRHLVTIHPEEKFENIVKIIIPPSQVHLSVTDECQSEDVTKSHKEILVTENKLLHKAPEPKDSTNDNPHNFVNDTLESPLIKHINVITTAPIFNKEIFVPSVGNITQEATEYPIESIFHENQLVSYRNSISTNVTYELSDSVKPDNINAENVAFVNNVPSYSNKSNQTDQQDIEKRLGYFHTQTNQLEAFNTDNLHQQDSVGYNGPPLTRTLSSVIRSVGNVKKKLICDIDTVAKATNNTPLEYKHKKYCRNHYNIDLYRKILGCDEDDGDDDGERQQKCEHELKSSTPLHWRKNFKYNYETSSS